MRLTTRNFVADAAEKAVINAPETEITGHLTIRRGITWGGVANGLDGPAQTEGGLNNTGGEISSNGKVLDTHTHTCPDGQTGGPN